MKAARKRDWLDECFEYEAAHPIAFASPRALVEARLIAELDKARRPIAAVLIATALLTAAKP